MTKKANKNAAPIVAIIMGSKSDWPTMVDGTKGHSAQKLMKRFAKILLILLVVVINAYPQKNAQNLDWQRSILSKDGLSKKEDKESINKYDFGTLWTNPDNSYVYGFIGDNYQRIRIKIILATKDKNDSGTYLIKGKSMVKGNIWSFSGSVKITHARTYDKMHSGVDGEYKNAGIKKQGILIAKYHFLENNTQPHSGIFDGLLMTSWYVDRNGKLKYDDLEKDSDSYSNNQFVGTWKGYTNKLIKVCNWGDYRVPFSGDLDIGAGEFSPAEKYLQFGWQSVRDAYLGNDKQARKQEEDHWWK